MSIGVGGFRGGDGVMTKTHSKSDHTKHAQYAMLSASGERAADKEVSTPVMGAIRERLPAADVAANATKLIICKQRINTFSSARMEGSAPTFRASDAKVPSAPRRARFMHLPKVFAFPTSSSSMPTDAKKARVQVVCWCVAAHRRR
jgi:hypothetical protein